MPELEWIVTLLTQWLSEGTASMIPRMAMAKGSKLVSGTQSPIRTTTMSSATLPPVDLETPIWIKTPTGPHTDQQQVGQLSS